MGVKRIVLEHHGDVPVFRMDLADLTVTDENFAGGDGFKARDHPQQCRFTASGRAKKDNKAAIVDFQIKVMNDLNGPESLVNVFNFYLRQDFPPWCGLFQLPKRLSGKDPFHIQKRIQEQPRLLLRVVG